MIEAMVKNFIKYVNSPGMIELKEKLVEKFKCPGRFVVRSVRL